MDTRIKLQRAARAFLARLIELHGLEGAARVLRAEGQSALLVIHDLR